MRLSQHTSGFTLIELSIVLVIIGLIAGGVLVGRDMIEAALIRKQISQTEQIATAANAFKNKYRALPGDMYATAEDFGLSDGNATGKRDDGIIQDMLVDSPIHSVWYEPLYFFAHLVEANLIPRNFLTGMNNTTNVSHQGRPCQMFDGGDPLTGEGAYYATIINPRAGQVAQTFRGYIWTYLGISDCGRDGDFPNPDWDPIMTPHQAYSIDVKIDNGIPGSGNVLAMKSEAFVMVIDDGVPVGGAGPATRCVRDATSQAYDLTRNTNQCRLMIRLQ